MSIEKVPRPGQEESNFILLYKLVGERRERSSSTVFSFVKAFLLPWPRPAWVSDPQKLANHFYLETVQFLSSLCNRSLKLLGNVWGVQEMWVDHPICLACSQDIRWRMKYGLLTRFLEKCTENISKFETTFKFLKIYYGNPKFKGMNWKVITM